MFDDAYNPDRDQQFAEMINAGQLDLALQLLEDWREREPWNGEVLMRMAVVHWLSGEPARTLRDLDSYLEIDPNNAEALSRRAQALIMLGKREDAEVALAKAEALDPTTPGVLLNRGLLHEEQGNYLLAIDSLTAYLEVIPSDHLAIARRSHLHRQLGNFPQALADAELCVSMQPEDPEVHFAEALARVTLEQGEEALAACDRCLTLQTAFLPALRLKIDLLADLGRIPEAAQHLAQLEVADPNSPPTALLQARVATERQDFTTALACINRYLEDAPDEEHGYYRRGMIYLRMEDYQRALADFEAYTRMAPTAAEGYEQQLMCLLELGRVEEALTLGALAVNLHPKSYRLQFNLAFAKLIHGNLAEAQEGFLLSLQLEPDNDELALRIYLALAEHMSPVESLTMLHTLAQQVASPSVMLKGLEAECYLENGRPEEALRIAQQLLTIEQDRTFVYLLAIKAQCLLNHYPEAAEIAEIGVAALPDDGQLRLARALVLRDTGKPEDALTELDIAAELLPEDAEVLRQRALVYGSVGQITEAISLLKDALTIDANNSESLFWLAYFLIHRQEYREALESAGHLLAQAPASTEGHLVRGVALRGLQRDDEADVEIARVQQDDPTLLIRLGADPVIAGMLTPQNRGSVSDRIRRSMTRYWHDLCRTLGYGS